LKSQHQKFATHVAIAPQFITLKETSIPARQNRKRVWRGKCQSHPKAAAEAIRGPAPDAAKEGQNQDTSEEPEPGEDADASPLE
ncbi:MAG: hypothetical protein WBW81_03145, partial [Methylocella sp.]